MNKNRVVLVAAAFAAVLALLADQTLVRDPVDALLRAVLWP